MVKFTKFIWSVVLILALFCLGGVMADKYIVRNGVIRLHVLADSDSLADQQIKLSVRDAIVDYLSDTSLQTASDTETAKRYLSDHLEGIEKTANNTLQALGSDDRVTVTLNEEEYGTRQYDTFSLPAGVYDSLRVQIGSGEGQNWWCVIFPSLCTPETSAGFKDAAVSSGFEQGLSNALAGDEGYEIRFFFMDCLGKLENFFRFN